jgi:hypothetical protein
MKKDLPTTLLLLGILAVSLDGDWDRVQRFSGPRDWRSDAMRETVTTLAGDE